jgi:hypothetical protein
MSRRNFGHRHQPRVTLADLYVKPQPRMNALEILLWSLCFALAVAPALAIISLWIMPI